MKINKLTIRDLISKTRDNIIKSDIDLQREIVFDDEKQSLVIESIFDGISLPAFYLWSNSESSNESLEILDGKQRHNAIKRFINNDLLWKKKNWNDIKTLDRETFYNTEISIIIHSGNEAFKQKIFYRINSLGVPLSKFEVIYGLYYGNFLEQLKKWFNDNNELKSILPARLLKRKGISRGNGELFMLSLLFGKKMYLIGKNKFNSKEEVNNKEEINLAVVRNKEFNGSEEQKKLRQYYRFVIEVFGNNNKNNSSYANQIDTKFVKKHCDLLFRLAKKYYKQRTLWKSERTNIKNKLTDYIESDNWKLSKTRYRDVEALIRNCIQHKRIDPRRLFSNEEKNSIFKQVRLSLNPENAKCKKCNFNFAKSDLELDHIIPWSKGGATELSNAQLLCKSCNSRKSDKS